MSSPPARSLPVRTRALVLLLGVVTLAGSATPVAAAERSSKQEFSVWQPTRFGAPTQAPPVSAQRRIPVPVDTVVDGIDDPGTVALSTPDLTLSGAGRRDARASGETFDAYSTGGTTHSAAAYSGPVNVQLSSGRWVSAADLLRPIPQGWGAQVGSTTVDVPSDLGAAPVSVSGEDGLFTLRPTGAAASGRATASGSVSYPNPWQGTAFEVRPSATGALLWALTVRGERSVTPFAFTVTSEQAMTAGEGGSVVVGDLNLPDSELSAPLLIDGSGRMIDGAVSTSLTTDTSGSTSVTYTIDAKYAKTAKYPVSVTGTYTQRERYPARDGYTSGNDPNSWFGGYYSLYTSTINHTFIEFDTSDLQRDGRIVYGASMALYKADGTGPDPVNVRRILDPWTGATWNNEPAVGGEVIDESRKDAPWFVWDVGTLYQNFLDNTWGDRGLRLAGNEFFQYWASEALGFVQGGDPRPRVLIAYNDLPAAPNPDSPVSGDVVPTDSPALKLDAMPNDINDDDVMVQFQVSDQNTGDPSVDYAGSHLVYTSPWLDHAQVVVPSGILLDGERYFWRARSWDVCEQPDKMCSLTDARGNQHEQKASGVRSFVVNIPNRGADGRWAMWSQGVGNGITLQVNEGNGNVFLDMALEELSTPIGELGVNILYNSQQGEDYGLSRGWDISAGPIGSIGGSVPIALKTLSPFPQAGLQIRFRDGTIRHFPHLEGRRYGAHGANAGQVVRQPNNGGYVYIAPGGGRYTFNEKGGLTEAKPVFGVDESDAVYTYSYNANDSLAWVQEPLGRKVTFDWTNGKLTGIQTWDGRTWVLGYGSANNLNTVSITSTNTVTGTSTPEVVNFDYYSSGGNQELLRQIRNGVVSQTNRAGWLIDYVDQGGFRRVSSILPPPGLAQTAPTGVTPPTFGGWAFSYLGGFKGNTSLTTCITDPRNPSPNLQACAGAYQTKIDFNVAGYPIQVTSPADQNNYRHVTTMLWDSNGNMLCKRDPVANAIRLACTSENNMDPDRLSAFYTYQNDAPFAMKTKSMPAPDLDTQNQGDGARLRTTYSYDQGPTFVGLWSERYGNDNLSGLPRWEGISADMAHDWGAGSPEGIALGDHWSIRSTGLLDISDQQADLKEYRFEVFSDDGVTVRIGDKTIVDCFGEGATTNNGHYNCGKDSPVSNKMKAGRKPISIEFSELTGNAELRILWDQGPASDPWVPIPAERLLPDIGLLTDEEVEGATGSGTIPKTHTSYAYPSNEAKARSLVTFKTVDDVASGDQATTLTTSYEYNRYGQVSLEETSSPDNSYVARTDYTYTNGTPSWNANINVSCLTRIVAPTGAVTDYQCDRAGRRLQQSMVIRAVESQPAQTRTTSFTYDTLGRLVAIVGPGNAEGRSTYDAAGRRLTTSVLANRASSAWATTTTTYDDRGKVLTETGPAVYDFDSATTKSPVAKTYTDWLGQETAVMDARGKVGTTAYDALGRAISSTSPLGLVSSTNFVLRDANAFRNKAITTDANGVATTSVYDMLGRVTSTKIGNLNPTVTTYNIFDDPLSATDPAGVRTTTDYNGLGMELSSTSFAGSSAAATTTYTYDSGNRLRKVDGPRTDADDSTIYGYDLAGRVTSAKNPAVLLPGTTTAATVSVIYDDAGERVRVDQPMTSTVTQTRKWTYDLNGKMATYIDARGTTRYTYDDDGHLKSEATPDPDGTGPRTGVTRFDYDLLGRETCRYADAATVCPATLTATSTTTKYDLVGNVREVATAGAKTTTTYDADGRALTVSQLVGTATNTTTYSYADAVSGAQVGQLRKIVDPAGTTTMTYDTTTGALATLTDPLTTKTTTYTYEPGTGRQTGRSDPALTWTRTYEPLTGRVSAQVVTKTGTTTELARFAQTYDAAGNVATKTSTVSGNADAGAWIYSYDGGGRLLTSKDPANVTTAYAYDGASNRVSVQVGAAAKVSMSYDAAGHPVSSDAGTPASTTDDILYTANALGELTKIDKPGTTADSTYTFDAWGRATAATVAATSQTMAYDGLNRLITRTIGKTATSQQFRGTSESLVKSVTGTATTLCAVGPNGPIAQKGTATQLMIRDLHGDVVGLVDTGTKALVGSQTYDPWGQGRTKTGTVSSTLGFQGAPTDPTTKQVDMGARLYEPTLGRFVTRDPMFGDPSAPGSLNQFGYGLGNPVTLADPTGLGPPSGHIDTSPHLAHTIARHHEQAVAAQSSTDSGGNPTTSGASAQPAPQPRIARAAELSVKARMEVLKEFFARYPGTEANGEFGFGQGVIDFTGWEVDSGRLTEEPAGWWNAVNGSMVLDIKRATNMLEAGKTTAQRDGVQGWIDYASIAGDSSAGGATQQAAMWRAHQTSLHEAINTQGAQKRFAEMVQASPNEGLIAAAVLRNVDITALKTAPGTASDSQAPSGATNLGYFANTYGSYPAGADDVGRAMAISGAYTAASSLAPTGIGVAPIAPPGDVGLSSTRDWSDWSNYQDPPTAEDSGGGWSWIQIM